MSLSPLMLEKLKRALNARRVALVGASQEQLSVGMGPLYNLLGTSFQQRKGSGLEKGKGSEVERSETLG